jgi:hypothetical protein
MITDEERRTEELDFVEANVSYLAKQADGQFIDLKVRPKNKRVKWTEESYRKTLLGNIQYWRTAPINDYMRYVYGVKGFVLQALDNQFTRFRDVHALLRSRPADPAPDREKQERRDKLRTEQADMDELDKNRKCLDCGKFLFHRDETNNKIHEKKEVCTCHSSRHIQAKMAQKTSDYRESLKQRKKKDPKRYQR